MNQPSYIPDENTARFSAGGWQTRLLVAMLLFSLIFEIAVIAAAAGGSRFTTARPLKELIRESINAAEVDRKRPPGEFEKDIFTRQIDLGRENVDRMRPHSALDWISKFGMLPGFGVMAAWMLWSWRAYSNLACFRLPGLRFSPVWAVLAFIIPLANIVLPFLVFREIWKASGGRLQDPDWQAGRTSTLLITWFIVDLITVFASLAAAVTMYISNDAYTFSAVLQGFIVIVLAILSLLLVRSFNRRQADSFRRLSTIASS